MAPIERASASEQIANELRRQIEAGELPAGEPLPSDAELARRFEVSKPTVTKARAMLVALGLVASRAGAPSIVRGVDAQEAPATPGRPRIADRPARIYPAGHYATILSARLVSAPPDVAEALRQEVGAAVIQRRRITYGADEVPLTTSTTYLPGHLAESCPALLDTRRIRQGTTAYVEQQTGRTAASMFATVASRPAGPAGDALRLPPGSYGLELTTTINDADGAAIAYELEMHPPETPVAFDMVPDH